MYILVFVNINQLTKTNLPINFSHNIFDIRIQLLKNHHTKKDKNNSDFHEDNPTNKKLREIAEFYAKHKAASGVNSFSAFASNKMETLQRLEYYVSYCMSFCVYIVYFLLFVSFFRFIVFLSTFLFLAFLLDYFFYRLSHFKFFIL